MLKLIQSLTVGKDESRSWGRVCSQASETGGSIGFEKCARFHFGEQPE